jgi:hypothetical protein
VNQNGPDDVEQASQQGAPNPMMHEVLTSAEREVLADFDHLLGDRAVWEPTDPTSSERVISAIDAERAPSVRQPRRRWLGLVGAVVVGAAAATVVAVMLTRPADSRPEAAFAMTGTALAPGLSGAATVNTHPSGVEIEIKMPGLPRRDGGQYYELWMHTCDGSQWVPAGTFHDTGYVVAWAGVSIHDYPMLKVTREVAGPPNGATQAPSKDVVAWGSLGSCAN